LSIVYIKILLKSISKAGAKVRNKSIIVVRKYSMSCKQPCHPSARLSSHVIPTLVCFLPMSSPRWQVWRRGSMGEKHGYVAALF
jgi:hypothetical protein